MDNSGRGKLYVSKFDGRIHLYGAEWGCWRIDQNAEYYQGWDRLWFGLDKNPNRFATVKYTDTDNNGFFALCIDGKLFPDEIENAVIPVGVRDVKVALSGIPVDEKIFDMDSKDAILILYDLVYPEFDDEKSDEENRDNDFWYLLSTNELVDDNYLVFAVGKERKIRILGTKAEYDFEEKRDVLCNSKVTEIILEKDYVNNVIAQLEEIKWN